MANFSQSFCMGEETLNNIEKQIKCKDNKSVTQKTRSKTTPNSSFYMGEETINNIEKQIKCNDNKSVSQRKSQNSSFYLGEETLNNIDRQIKLNADYSVTPKTLLKTLNSKTINKSLNVIIDETPKKEHNEIKLSESNNNENKIYNNSYEKILSQLFDDSGFSVEANKSIKKREDDVDIVAICKDWNAESFFEKNIEKIDSNDTSEICIEIIENMFDKSDECVETKTINEELSFEKDIFTNVDDAENDYLNNPIFSEDLCNISISQTEREITKTDWENSNNFDLFNIIKESNIEIVEEEIINTDNVTFTENAFLENSLNITMRGSETFVLEEMEKSKGKLLNSLIEENQFISQQYESEKFITPLIKTLNNDVNKSILNETQDFKKRSNNNKNMLLLSNWGLPKVILNEYHKKGIHSMFNWQTECLSNPKILFDSTNLVYSAPTSAGKTLVSEILLIKNIVEMKKKALMILPFISVVREKMYYLQEILVAAGFRVEGFFGGYSPPGGFDRIHVAICTIEKANSIINKLLEQNKLSDIGIIIVDEIHLISDPSRGYILELLLAKILFMCKKYNLKIQIVTMSATLPNLNLLTKWLNAEFYYTNFRPVELREMIKINNCIYDNEMKLIRKLDNELYSNINKDQDNIGQLCIETILENCSVIVFCPSKDWCEKLCLHLAEFIYKIGKSNLKISNKLREKINIEKLNETKLQLTNSTSGLDDVLNKTISYACAFHHAGLTTDERDIIESEFKNGTLKIIVATSTLSSGVNLPSRRVIIRTPLFGGKMMNSITYKQMIGRAGRTGKDTLGESILICTEATSSVGKELVCSKLNPITSCLDLENNANLKRAILEVISSGVATTKNDLEMFSNCTLLSAEKSSNQSVDINKNNNDENENQIQDPIAKSIEFLVEYEFIRLQLNVETNEMNYISTRLGNACLSSSMPPNDGFLLFSELQKARQCFVLESELHAIYLVTPYSVCYQLQEIDWLFFLDLWEKLPSSMKRVGELVGIKDSFLVKAMRGNSKLEYKILQIHKRFYIALALQELINEIPICSVAIKYKCSRGLLQSLQQMASTFAGIVTSFCNSLNWQMLGNIMSNFKERLYFGISHDLMDLMKIPNLTSSIRARALFNNNIKTLIDLANSDILTIENILYNCASFDSEKKRDNENEYDAVKRNNIRNLYVTGKSGITVKEAATLLITDARQYLENEMGVQNVNWTKKDNLKTLIDVDIKIVSGNNKRQSDELLNISCDVSPPKIRTMENVDVMNNKENNDLNNSKLVNESLDEIMNSQTTTIDFKTLQTQSTSRILRSRNKNDTLNNNNNNNNSNNKTDNINNEIFMTDNKLILNKPLKSLNRNNVEEQNTSLDQLDIIDVCLNKEVFKEFLIKLENINEISFSIGLEKLTINQTKIGVNLLPIPDSTESNETFHCIYENRSFICGIAIILNDNIIYYLDLQNNLIINLNKKLNFLKLLFERVYFTIKMFDAKEQLTILMKTIMEITKINGDFEDPKIAHWLLQPDIEGSLESMAVQYAHDFVDLTKLAGKSTTYSGVGINYNSSITGKLRASIECYVTQQILNEQKERMKNIGNGEILKHFKIIEMPIQLSLLKMELFGFPINVNDGNNLINLFEKIIKEIEIKIFALNGRKFNLSSSREMAKVLGIQNKTNKKISITKETLELLDTPISNLILQYRKLSGTLSRSIIPLTKIICNNRIYGKNVSFTQTGRISMHEPNLQSVARDFEIKESNISHLISCRQIFKTEQNRYFISADFCQLELRILTHLSKDKLLLEIMNSKEDIFKIIASKWNNVSENDVTDVMRHNTKQITYGIIYGMGIRSLSVTLKTDEVTVTKFIDQFHKTYPGLRNYTEKILKDVRENEYVETMSGRRRYFPNINSDDNKLKVQAERQAINTTIQGSAADIAKSAILRMERNLKKYQNDLQLNIDNIKSTTNNRVDLVLHLHDELIYEVPLDKHKNLAKILKYSMENCAKLSVPLRVKVKVGNSWGNLNEINV